MIDWLRTINDLRIMSQYCAAYLLSKYNGNRDNSTNAEWCVCLNSQFGVNDL